MSVREDNTTPDSNDSVAWLPLMVWSQDQVPAGADLTLTHAAKGPKGLSCFEKQTAKHFLKLKFLKNLDVPGKLYVDYFPFYNN